MPASRAGSFCGKGAHFHEGGCAARDCGKDWLDLATGACVPVRTLRDLMAAQGVSLASEERPGCSEDEALVVDGERVACVQANASCGRGAHRKGNTCVPNGACPPGELPDRGGCVRFLSRDGGRLLVDVGTWTRLAIGPDGGMGGPEACATLAQRPWAVLGDEGAGTETVRIAVEVGFDDNDVTRLRARFTGSDARTGRPLAPRAAAAVEAALRPLTDALHDVGGTSSAAAVSVVITCVIPASRQPVAVPWTDGGLE